MKKLFLLPSLLLAACSSSASDDSDATPVALVSVAKVKAGSVPRTIAVFGAADAGASGSRSLTAPIDATLVSIDAPVGSKVGVGQLIARIRPSPAVQLDVSKTAAEARSATLAYGRARRLRADGLVSDADVESAGAAAETATAALSNLTHRTRDTALVAPISGTVGSVSASPGAIVAAGTTVATIYSDRGIRGRFGVDPATARAITPGALVRFAPSAGGATFSAPVISVDPVVDPQTRFASVYVALPPQIRIGTGEPLRGEIVMGGASDSAVVPYSALLDDGGQPFVFVVEKSKARRRNVRVIAVDGQFAAIGGGVATGELVVTKGGTALEDGMKVRTR